MAATSAPAIPGIQEPRTVPRRSLILVAAAGVAAGAVLLAVAYANFYDLEDPDHSSHWVRVAQFLLWIAVGEIAWVRRPANPLGRWMIVVGFVGLFVNTLWLAPVAVTWTLSLLLANVQITLVAYVFLSFPDGRLRERADRVLMALIVAYTTVWQLVLVAIEPTDLNLLNVTRDESIQSVLWAITDWTTVILTLAAMSRVVVHWRKSPPAGRRVLTPILVALVPYLVVLVLQRLAPVLPQNVVTDSAASWGGAVVPGFALPIGFLVGILRTQLARSVVGDVVRELDAGVEPGRLVGVLQRALGDPSLQLAYRLPDGSFVDAGGQPVALPAPRSDRSVTPLSRGGETTEILIHDPSVETDPELVASVAAAARLALENERLHAEIRAQLEEVRASRTRIVEAGFDARRKVERDLHDGASSSSSRSRSVSRWPAERPPVTRASRPCSRPSAGTSTPRSPSFAGSPVGSTQPSSRSWVWVRRSRTWPTGRPSRSR